MSGGSTSDNGGDAQADSGSFDQWWVLIPLAALSIPILAVSPWMAAGLIGVALIAAVTIAAKVIMNHRHRLKLQELGMRQRIAEAEASQLESANRVIEQNAQMRDLREAINIEDATKTASGDATPRIQDS